MMRGEMEAPDPNTERLNPRKKHAKPREDEDSEAPAGTGGRERTADGVGNAAMPKMPAETPAASSVPARDSAHEHPKAAPVSGYGGYPSAAATGQKATPMSQHHQQPQQHQQAPAAAAPQR